LNPKVKKLIIKYCINQLKDKELEELNIWLEKDDNKTFFQEYIALNYTIEKSKKLNHERLKQESWNYINKRISNVPIKKNYWKYGIAASIAVLFGLTYFLTRDSFSLEQSSEELVINNNIDIGTDKATLTLEDGTNVVLEKGNIYSTENVTSDGEKVVYNKSKTNVLVYNSLKVPKGGQFYLELSDDTKVWLNSDSKIRYPKEFIEDQDRVVELLYGEAYFDVSPSIKHNGAKFKVVSNMQKIEVLGTEFNVKAYKDEKHIYTTLVEGSVTLSTGKGSTNYMLKPNQRAKLDINSRLIEKENNIDVLEDIAWIKGDFVFERKPLKEIMKVLSRWYNVEVLIEDESIENIEFTGKLSKNQNIEEILILIKNTNIISDYEIKNKTIHIK